MQLGHLLTRSSLTYAEVPSKAYHDSFCRSDSTVSLPWVIYFEAFYLHVVSSFSCIPVICLKLVLFLTPLQFVHLFYAYIYTGCNRRNGPDFGRVFLMLYYTDITQNTYVQSRTVTETIAREKCGLHRSRRTIRRP